MLIDLTRDEIATAKLSIEREMKTHSSVVSVVPEAEREHYQRLYYKLACYLNGTLPEFEIEPQRDELKGEPFEDDGGEPGGPPTRFVQCDEAEAEVFAVFKRIPGDAPGGTADDWDWVEDFPSRAAAEAFIAQKIREG